jgi:hypothetical protein
MSVFPADFLMWINANGSLTVHLLFWGCASGEKVGHFGHAEHLRGRAEEFRRLAQSITEERTRNSFLELARTYDALANEEEALAMGDEKIRAALIFNT